MAIHVEQVTTDVAMFDGELPLSDAQMRKLIAHVAAHVLDCKRDERERRQTAKLDRSSVLPETEGGG